MSDAKGGETGYAVNKTQWFFEEKMPDVRGLADTMYEEMLARGWSPDSVDWKVVEQRLAQFLANQSRSIVEQLRDSLKDQT